MDAKAKELTDVSKGYKPVVLTMSPALYLAVVAEAGRSKRTWQEVMRAALAREVTEHEQAEQKKAGQ